MQVHWLEPAFLLLGVVVLLPWVGTLRTRDLRHGLLRSAMLACIVLALARPVQRIRGGPVHRVWVLDRSPSLPAAADDDLRTALASVLDSGEPAGRTVVEITGPGRAPLELPDGVRHLRIDGGGSSPLGRALAAGLMAVPSGARGGITVWSDGLGTGDPWPRTARDLRARGLPVDWVEVAPVDGDLRPVALVPRGVIRVGAGARIDAVLVGGGQVVDCRLLDPDGVLATAAGIRVEGRTTVSLGFEPRVAGFREVTLEVEVVEGGDPVPGDGSLRDWIAVQDPLRVLYLGERVQGGAEELAKLVGPGFEVLAPDPQTTPQVLEHADLVVLDDRPAERVPEDLQRSLVGGVVDRGLGLLAAGGEAAFGPGGYHEQPLEAVLPVEFVQKEEKRDPSTTLVIIIDTSGSMGGNRVQLAKEVSRLAIRRLLPHDKVGIVEFYGAKRWAAPIQPASNSIEIERALNRLNAGGGTVILPAIEEAYYGLKNVRTRFKHVLILTDGGVEAGAFEPLLRRMSDDGMNVSTVLIGPDAHSEFLVNLANWGKGRFYAVPNRFNLPEILLKQPASAKLPAYRPGTVTVRGRGGRGWWGEVDPASVPPLAGYVETRVRPGAERVLETAAEAHPILASWRYGLGRVSALTTEPTGPGTAPWSEWKDYGSVLARVLTRTAADTSEPFAFRLTVDGEEALLIAERRGPGDLAPQAEVLGPDAPRTLAFQRVAPDRFEARWSPADPGPLRVEAGPRGDGAPRRRLVHAAPGGPADREHLVDPRTAESLGEWIVSTGGRIHRGSSGALGTVPVGGGEAPVTLRPLWPLAVALALLAYLLDVYHRRRPRRRAPSRS